MSRTMLGVRVRVASSSLVVLAAVVVVVSRHAAASTNGRKLRPGRELQQDPLDRQGEFELYQQAPTIVDNDESLLDQDHVVLQRILQPLIQEDDNDNFVLDDSSNAESFFRAAFNVYDKGGHAQPFSVLSLSSLSSGTDVERVDGTLINGGVNNQNEPLPNGQVTIWDDAAAAGLINDGDDKDTTLLVLYHNKNAEFQCQVGGLPLKWQKKDGCLKDSNVNDSSSGNTVRIQGQTLEYMNISHANGRTLAQLSSLLRRDSLSCQKAPCGQYYKDYFSYYGEYDYATEWVKAALRGQPTVFARGNVDFSKQSPLQRAAFLQTSPVVFNVWMSVIGKLERALNAVCDGSSRQDNSLSLALSSEGGSTGGGSSRSGALQLWEEAKALYMGSIASAADDDNNGVFLYALAQDLCQEFQTCPKNATSETATTTMAMATQEWMKYWKLGRDWLLDQQRQQVQRAADGRPGCPSDKIAIFSKLILRMVSQMTVPLIQGLLRSSAPYVPSAKDQDNDDDDKTTLQRQAQRRGQGVAFLAALLPRIHVCDMQQQRRRDSDDKEEEEKRTNTAATLYQLWNPPFVERTPQALVQVKVALESNYECLGITCDMVGTMAGDNVPACAMTHDKVEEGSGSSSSSDGANNDNGNGRKDQTVTAVIATAHVAIILIVVAVMGWCMLRARCYSTSALAPRHSMAISSDDGGPGDTDPCSSDPTKATASKRDAAGENDEELEKHNRSVAGSEIQ